MTDHASRRVLVTFSVPFIPVFYFLHTSAGGGVDFGVLGFCGGPSEGCSPRQYVAPSNVAFKIA